MRDSNEISTAIPMFLRLSNMTALVQTLSYVRMSVISEMAACNRKCVRNNITLDSNFFRFVNRHFEFLSSWLKISRHLRHLKKCAWAPLPVSEIYVLSYILELHAVIFDFSCTPTNGSVKISPVVLPDIANILSMTVGISMVDAAILDFKKLLPFL